jgi:hypothetical protein
VVRDPVPVDQEEVLVEAPVDQAVDPVGPEVRDQAAQDKDHPPAPQVSKGNYDLVRKLASCSTRQARAKKLWPAFSI